MKKGNETEVIVTLQMPVQKPMHIPGILIMEGMTAKEIERAMIEVSKLVVTELVASGKMCYFSYVGNGKVKVRPKVPNLDTVDDGY